MLGQVCEKLCLSHPPFPLSASRQLLTWCQYRYYYRCVSSQAYGYTNVITGRQRSSSTRGSLLQSATVRAHSTERAHKWEIPQGYATQIKIYHPLVKEQVPLVLLQEKLAHWYACGPTVYDSPHIGHASSYVRLDIIRRIMSSVFGIDTTLVMGVTDIDDKIIQKSNQTGQNMAEITQLYESEFFASLAKLKVTPPSITVRVTDHVSHIIDFIRQIEQKGYTYRTADGSLYFDVNKYGHYGAFINMQIHMSPETDTDKRAPQDFALWKAVKPGEPFWDSPWGKGRPGWHIECSAMASHVFGSNFDIHSGGEDLTFPHHENELAQSCAYHGNTQWVNYWLHTGHLFLSGQTDKMSKSLKNVISVSELLQDYTPNHFRMLCLLNNYKNRIEFSAERMQKAVSLVATLNSIISRCDFYVKGQVDCGDIPEAQVYEKLQSTRQTVEAAYADDFNTPRALAHIMRLVKFMNQLLEEVTHTQTISARSPAPVAAVGAYIGRVMNQLGLDFQQRKVEDDSEQPLQFYSAVETLVSTRWKIREFARDKQFVLRTAGEVGVPEDQAARLMKKLYSPLWNITDGIREDIRHSAHVEIRDGASGSTWTVVDSKKKSPVTDSSIEATAPHLNVSQVEDSNNSPGERKFKTPS
ncbi:unnamed protein product [Candidula unifasciata]|uniref:cysteine--tRNA ligase n=1 Tax=Candidula unifasciata TaxID=100452 RepID=A0A8S3YIB5_9EUPU|nr:unnamed protein product [Candidula unifasciata]